MKFIAIFHKSPDGSRVERSIAERTQEFYGNKHNLYLYYDGIYGSGAIRKDRVLLILEELDKKELMK
ncbi:hypothetical protein IX51_08000 [uncultured archaeon]|nr:hypothetical protein IX51_08000 [uncultured archaeon]